MPATPAAAQDRAPLDAVQRLVDQAAEECQRPMRQDPRRTEPRYPIRAHVELYLRNAGPGAANRRKAWAVDISQKGVGLLVDNPVATGVELNMSLLRDGQQPVKLAIRVVHCTQLVGRVYKVGAVFSNTGQ